MTLKSQKMQKFWPIWKKSSFGKFSPQKNSLLKSVPSHLMYTLTSETGRTKSGKTLKCLNRTPKLVTIKGQKSKSFTCTPLDLNPGHFLRFLRSQNGLYQWTITHGLCWNHFTILMGLPHNLKQNHQRWWNQKSKKLWDFCWDPNKVLMLTASLSFNVIIMSTAKYSAHLCVGTYILGWWWCFSTTMLWCEVEKKTKSKECAVHMMTSA